MGFLIINRYPISAESEGERSLKIGQHLPKLWARIKVGVFSEHSLVFLCHKP